MQRIGIGVCLVYVLCLLLEGIRTSPSTFAQGKPEDIGTIHITKETTDINYKPVLVSLYRAGKKIRAEDSDPEAGIIWGNLPHGEYEVRFEKEGFRTIVKRIILADLSSTVGARLLPGNSATVLGGPSLQEMETRIRKLEADVAALQKTRQR